MEGRLDAPVSPAVGFANTTSWAALRMENGMTAGKVCVIGSFMMDLVAEAPRRPQPGETLRGTAFRCTPGGKGYNQAIAAARAGAQTALLGSLGDDDFARSFQATFAAEGIDASGVRLAADQGTGVGLPVVEPGGQNSIIIIPRANLTWTLDQVQANASAIEAADVVLAQFEVPLECVTEAARIANDAGTLVVVNPAPFAPVPKQLFAHSDLMVLNETELRDLCQAADGSLAALYALAAGAACEKCLDLVVTLGPRGALIAWKDGSLTEVPARKADAVDTVGAGDVFCGNLGTALARGESLISAVELANAAASISVTRPGGGCSAPTLDETLALLAE
ncbi:MAG: ribokinase [Propionibacteriaceae bacterium]|jgi:ribokinase|nr:ribokinase [Propionibacteriaceae bacterium]